ncbi:threonine/serine ThrE exporter family protein [Granulosicoccus sp. 3-233]|uniref:threonine/serine ThrE exporter family protein n=1 Tax=Granulosicoccus sp. 3-233 TaxID=3417969 RepID=UPI003D356765
MNAIDDSDKRDDHDATVRILLAQLGAAMIATSQAVHEIEAELIEVAAQLGYPNIQVAASPTGLILSLRSGDPATYESVSAAVRLDQASEVRRIRHQLHRGELQPDIALEQLSTLRARATRYPQWLVRLAWVMMCLGITLILQPGWGNAVIVVVCSVVVYTLMAIARRARVLSNLLPVVAAFVITTIVFGAAGAGWIEGPLRTLLPPLAPLLPGALIVTGMSELAAGHMQAGSSRLSYGFVQLGLFAVGLIAATTVLHVPVDMLSNVRVDTIGWWAAPIGLLLIALGICLMESVELSLAPWVLLVLLAAFGAQMGGHALGSAAIGGFFGALAASLSAALVERIRPQTASLVLFLPAFWLLVPGSLGLIGVTTLVSDPSRAIETGLEVATVICTIALGLLVGSSASLALRGRQG